MTSYDDIDKHTPMMQQWASIKKQHPHALLLFRMGDFYEMFFEDAQKAAKLLDVTLTYRGESGGNKIPMAGVPYHAIEQYLAKLVRAGVACVIAEQFGEPGKGLLTRKVMRVITPGTVTESEWIGDKDESIVGAVFPLENGHWTLGWINLSTGSFKVLADVTHLNDAISRIQPTEILYPSRIVHADLTSNSRCRGIEDAWFDLSSGWRFLEQCFPGASAGALGWDTKTPMIVVAGALLRYIVETQGVIPTHLSWPVSENLDRYISLDISTRKNLELVQGLQGGVGKTLWGTLDKCSTTSGSRLLKRWICYPECSQSEARLRLDSVQALRLLTDTTWLGALEWCGDTERVVARLGLKTAKPKDLVVLRNALAQLPVIQVGLHTLKDVERLSSLARTLQINTSAQTLLKNTLFDNPRTNIKDGGVIADGIDDELDECRALLNNSDGLLRTMEQQERQSTGIGKLRIEYNRNGGYSIEISKGQVDKVPVHYQRKQTLKNVERFTTAALRDFETKALTAQDRALKREKALYEKLVEDLQNHMAWFVSMSQALSQLDVLASFATQAKQWNYVVPSFVEAPGIHIKEGRHPVVERYVDAFQSNDCNLDSTHRNYLITGPNMGGKSTFMRQTALIAVMAYIGCPVPALSCELGPLDAICTRIGASDDVASGRSTFMVEMEEAALIIENAGPKTLAILDEIGRGTSSIEGAALAQAILERLHTRNRALSMFATHYRDVALDMQALDGVVAIRAEILETPGEIAFTHKMVSGVADHSHGIHVAMLAGMADDVVARAYQLLQLQNLEPVQALVQENNTPMVLNALTLNLDDYSPRQLWEYINTLQQKGSL